MDPMSLEFEWDPAKAEANRRKHGVTFEEAVSVFGDLLARIFNDPQHSAEEAREIIVGYSDKRRLLLVASQSENRRFASSVRGPQPAANEKTMSKASKRSRKGSRNGPQAEYSFDYRKSRPNRFAARMARTTVAVVLEPDVAQVFDSSVTVNQLLRSVISALPQRNRRRRVRRKPS